MAQSGYTPISLYYSTTSGNIPSAANMVPGELAFNIVDAKLYYLNTSGVVTLLSTGGGSGTSGVSGYSGYSGYSGLGLSGYSGYSGAPGTGSSGSSGASGYSGYSGYSGSGISGYSGSGISGFSGFSGFSGISGYSGASSGSIIGTNNNFTGVNNFAQTVSIGSTSSPGTLYVKGGNSNNLLVDNNGQQYTTVSIYNSGTEKGQWYWDQTNNIMVLGTDVNSPLEFKTATVGRMQISGAGGVSIGTTTDPGADNLLVNGNITANNYTGGGVVVNGNSGTGSTQTVYLGTSAAAGTGIQSAAYNFSQYTSIYYSSGNVAFNVSSSGANVVFFLEQNQAQMVNSYPLTSANDGGSNLGGPSNRWNTVYATTGTINTSDANEKQQIADLTTAEKAVAQSIKSLFKTFKYNSAVAKKGDGARIHVGVMAQDVQSAFEAQGLDATKYGIFCSDTWEAEDAVLDKDGSVLIPAKTAGTRLGVRYEELLAFVIAAL